MLHLIALVRRHFHAAPLAGGEGSESELSEAALAHGLTGVVWGALASVKDTDGAGLAEWREVSRGESARMCVLTGALVELCQRLEAAGVDALALKGPALSALAWGSPACRSSSDLDILVRTDQVAAAVPVLRAQGFVPEGLGPATVCRGRKDLLLCRDVDDVCVELHWALYAPGLHVATDFEELWRRRTVVSVAPGRGVPTLSIEDTLLYLCVHGTIHAWSSLKWVCDVAALADRYPSVDWAALTARAARTGCSRMLAVGVVVAAGVCGTAVPPAIAAVCHANAPVRRLAQRTLEGVLSGKPRRDLSHPAAYCDRLRHRIAILGTKLAANWRPTSADFGAMRLPSPLRPLYLLIRPFRLVKAYGLRWLKAFVAT